MVIERNTFECTHARQTQQGDGTTFYKVSAFLVHAGECSATFEQRRYSFNIFASVPPIIIVRVCGGTSQASNIA
jgi:hypothetical protein